MLQGFPFASSPSMILQGTSLFEILAFVHNGFFGTEFDFFKKYYMKFYLSWWLSFLTTLLKFLHLSSLLTSPQPQPWFQPNFVH